MRSPSTCAVEASYSTHFRPAFGTPPESAVEGPRMSQAFEHKPVMVTEVSNLMREAPPGVVVDATVGSGGHSAAILRAHPRLRVLAIDRDPQAVATARRNLAAWSDRCEVHHARFDRLAELVDGGLSGVLFDLGVSSSQLDLAGRGFSYRADGPLDMRMDPTEPRTASDVVNGLGEEELARLFHDNGEGRFASRIARAVVRARPVRSTGQLAQVVRDALPAAARRTGGHPARRVFQAVRIEVNSELEILGGAVDVAVELLAPSGRCVVISYHSGEDRLVKDRFIEAASGGCTCPPGLPCGCGAQPKVVLLNRRARKPSPTEVASNPRADSARLRAVERLGPPAPAGTG